MRIACLGFVPTLVAPLLVACVQGQVTPDAPTAASTRVPTFQTQTPTLEPTRTLQPAAVQASETPTPIASTAEAIGVTESSSASLQLIFQRRVEANQIQGALPDQIVYLFRILGVDPGSLASDSVKAPQGWARLVSLAPDLIVVYMTPSMPSGVYLVSISLPDGQWAEATFEHVGEAAVAHVPSISDLLVFIRRLEPGALPDAPPDQIAYLFRVTGIDLDTLRPDSIQAPRGWGRGNPGLDSDVIVIYMSPSVPSGNYNVAITLPDGRRVEVGFEHTGEGEFTEFTKECSPWPSFIAELLEVLPTPEGLCLVRFSEISQAPSPSCIGCYEPLPREVWFSKPPPFGGELAALSHEACHAHQHWSTLEAGIGYSSWLETPEGKAFAAASQQAISETGIRPDPIAFDPWGAAPMEDFAQVCNFWYNPDIYGTDFFDRWPQLREFARQWLPTL